MEVGGQLHDVAALLPRKEPLVLNCTGGWVGRSVSLDVLENSEIGCPSPVAWPIPYSLYRMRRRRSFES